MGIRLAAESAEAATVKETEMLAGSAYSPASALQYEAASGWSLIHSPRLFEGGRFEGRPLPNSGEECQSRQRGPATVG